MPPIAWPEAKRLWNDDKGDGREKFLIAAHKYDRAIKALDAKQTQLHKEGKNKTKVQLVEKNRLIYETIAQECRKRGHMTLAEVKAVYDLKMTKGKYRPMLMKYPQQWSAKAIENQTKKAFDMCSLMNDSSDFRNATKRLNGKFDFIDIRPEISILIRRGDCGGYSFTWKGSVHATKLHELRCSNPKETRETVRGEKHSQ